MIVVQLPGYGHKGGLEILESFTTDVSMGRLSHSSIVSCAEIILL